MSRINANVSSLLARRISRQNNLSLTSSLERLSMDLRINRGPDDPASPVASEEIAIGADLLRRGHRQRRTADQVINITEGGLQEVSSMLIELQSLVDGSTSKAGPITKEKEANRFQIGAFQNNIIGSTLRPLGVALENTSAAENAIRDTDFAQETDNLTRDQIIVNTATNVLAIANSQPQSVLTILG